MNASAPSIVAFFLAMQRHLTATDASAIVGMFASQSLEASPSGTRLRQNDAVFRAAIEERLTYLLAAGMRDVKALEIEPTSLGADYCLVSVRWSVWCTPPGKPDFVDEFRVDYLVHTGKHRTEIAAVIAHDDDAELMRRLGLRG